MSDFRIAGDRTGIPFEQHECLALSRYGIGTNESTRMPDETSMYSKT
jgi:hypothetical protein